MRTLQRSQMGSVALYCSFLSFDIMPRLCLRWPQFVPLCGRPVSCALAVLSNTGCHNCFRDGVLTTQPYLPPLEELCATTVRPPFRGANFL